MSDETRRLRSARLRADCARCCGLCCVAPPFAAIQGFGFDKPADTPCRHLRADDRCTIHHELAARGFPACASFDCYGAGQWVTQHLFDGRSWRSSPAIAGRMFSLYATYRSLHELMALLDMASTQVLPREAAVLEGCLLDIERICQARAAVPDPLQMQTLRRQVLQLLQESLGSKRRPPSSS
jgi:hypothetical protein